MRFRHLWALGLLLILAVLAVIAGIGTGSFDFSYGEIWQALWNPDFPNRMVIMDLRLPRALLTLIVGAILSMTGFYMQALIKNPLADPYIMGVTAGAGFGVNLLILGLIPVVSYSIFTQPVFAGIGALVSLLFVTALGFRSFFEDNSKLLIAGVAVSAIFTAFTGLLIYMYADSDQVRRLVFWTFGSFNRANWEAVWVCLGLYITGLLFGLFYARKMDVLIMGDIQAATLGMQVSRIKLILLTISSLIVGGAVAFTGPIGFVGMIIPHFCRTLFGITHRPNLILGSVLGGVFLVSCDVLGRWIHPPTGLPIGIITAIVGVPFFLYILFSKQTYL